MPTEPIRWSEEKQQQLQTYLMGEWAQDTWPMKIKGKGVDYQRVFHFDFASSSLKVEFKYALWYQFESGQWKRDGDLKKPYYGLQVLKEWLNHVAPTASSLLERSLEAWEWSLRSYLLKTNQLSPTHSQRLTAAQTYVKTVSDDKRISLFRRVYRSIANAYDDRPETEKDIWDLRTLGLSLNLSQTSYLLNFTSITPPWLRAITKEFMNYMLAVHSAGDCTTKMASLRHFSRFLAESFPTARVIDIDRALVVKYISVLRVERRAAAGYNRYLGDLRVFLETCAHHLQIPGFSKERIVFDDDFAKIPQYLSREIPEEVLVQLREHVDALPTTVLRMVVILLECGLRLNELCRLPLDCLVCDDKHEWYLRFYQSKVHKEHIIPLVDEQVIGAIQAQQQDIGATFGKTCSYLFPSARSPLVPFKQNTFTTLLNQWAVKHDIRDREEKLYRFTAHQFRHTLGMRLINDDVPLEIISRLLGHRSLSMTQVYARKRDAQIRQELERVARKRKTVDAQGNIAKGDPRANDPEMHMTRKGMRGQTLPVGGCGRLVVSGECAHANKCLTCPMWLTSTEDLSALKSFYERAVRLKQRAIEKENQFVIEQQERIIANLTIRIKSLEDTEMDGTFAVDGALAQLCHDLSEAESALEEVRENGLIPAAKYLERTITDLKARLAALEESA
jgi:integrase/recombinase XerD